jgi:hypothetical protein
LCDVVVKFVLVAILEKFGGRFVCAPGSVNCRMRTGSGENDGPAPSHGSDDACAWKSRLRGMMRRCIR